jgi:uncharacterized repeat protein (TIGR03803 family)
VTLAARDFQNRTIKGGKTYEKRKSGKDLSRSRERDAHRGSVYMLLATAASPAQDAQASPDAVKFKTPVNFDEANGENPLRGLVQGTDGNLYGAATFGGAYNSGKFFKMTPSGALTVLYNFCATPCWPDGSGSQRADASH